MQAVDFIIAVVGSIMLWLTTFTAFAVCRIPEVRRSWVVSFIFTAVAYSFVQWGALYFAAYSGALGDSGAG